MIATLLTFLGLSALVIMTPGPDTALTVRNTLLGGERGGCFTALGVVAGQAIWVAATSLGVVAVLAASEPLFEAVKWLGAAYLVWLGLASLAAAWRGGPAPGTADVSAPSSRLAVSAAFRQGVLSNLGNPKMAMFFTSLLPQFAEDILPLLSLGLVFCTMTFVWLSAYALAIGRAGHFVRRRAVWRAIEAVAGVALVALGLRLASEQR
jgi:threonine/homoserine/homoserine lactone efflux protein